DARFDVIRKFHAQVEAGLMDVETAKSNLDMLGYKIFESEVDKFIEKNPDVSKEKFVEFLNATNALKQSGKKSTGSGRTRLNTPEAAAERGVAPENVDKYIALIEQVYATCKELNEIITKGATSFACPVPKEKAEA